MYLEGHITYCYCMEKASLFFLLTSINLLVWVFSHILLCSRLAHSVSSICVCVFAYMHMHVLLIKLIKLLPLMCCVAYVLASSFSYIFFLSLSLCLCVFAALYLVSTYCFVCLTVLSLPWSLVLVCLYPPPPPAVCRRHMFAVCGCVSVCALCVCL